MKKLTALFLSAILLAAVGCSKPIDENEKNDPSGNTENDPGIRQETPEPSAPRTVDGMVVAITKNEATSSVSETGMVTVLLDSGAKTVFPLSESFSEPSLGDRVTLTLEGESSSAVSECTVKEPFGAETLPAAVYSVKNIGTDLSMTEDFNVFSDYDECRKFLQDNSLDDEFDSLLGKTDITSLTDTFFASNDLCVFLANDDTEQAAPTVSTLDSGEEELLSDPNGTAADDYGGLFDGLESESVNGQVFADGRTLYLRVTQVSSAADTDGGSTVYLVPVQKGSVSEGILLLEKVLGNGMNIEENDSGTENGEPTEEMPEKETPEKNEPSSETDENDSGSDA